MSKAASTSTTSRRRLLAGVPAALVLPGAAAAVSVASNPDAELIALCAAFDVLERRIVALYPSGMDDADLDRADLIADAIREEQAPILDAITACRPSTLAGFTALAGNLALWDAELLKGDPMQGYTNDRLALVLVRGLLGRAGA